MKIFVTGTRGIPDIPGGIEKHCQELFPRIAAKGHETFLCTRKPYINKKMNEWQGINLINCFTPRRKSFEAIVHTFISLLIARMKSPDIVHIHAVGPSLLTPLARIMGLKVVITNHGPDYNRQKWGKLAKFMLRFGEQIGGIFANEIIVISSVIADIIQDRCHRRVNLIYNGVSFPKKPDKTDFLAHIGVEPKKYLLAVARFVPEKGLHDLINAFKDMDTCHKLVIAGDADYESDYSRKIREMAARDPRIVLTGYISGDSLNQIFHFANLFLLPSYHEGLPIALLEALSYGLPVLVSDIPANKEVGLPDHLYFSCGDVSDLRQKLEGLLGKEISEKEKLNLLIKVREKYDWDIIAEQTIEVYRKVQNN